MRISVKRPWVALVVALALFSSHQLQAQDGPSFQDRLIAAYDVGEASTVEALISENRLLVKPVVHSLISESLLAELSGDMDVAQHKLETATAIATKFEELFGERSLTNAVGYAAEWSIDQKRQKLSADSLFAAGTSQRDADETVDQALADYDEALAIYRDIGDGIGEASTLGGIGYIWYSYDTENAIQFVSEALEVRRRVDDRDLTGKSLNMLGTLYYSQVGDNAKAIDYYRGAETVRAEIGDRIALASTLTTMAAAYDESGNPVQALAAYERSISLDLETDQIQRAQWSLRNSGVILYELARYSEALSHLDRARDLAEDQGTLEDVAHIVNWIGVVYLFLGDMESALENLRTVVLIAEEVDDSQILSRALTNIGMVYLNAQRPERANDYSARALALYEEIGDQQGWLVAAQNLTEGLFLMGDFTGAESYAQEVLGVARTIQDKSSEGLSLLTLGNAQLYLDKFDEALVSHQAGYDLGRSIENPILQYWALLGFADNYQRQKDVDKALEYYDRALETVEATRSALQTEEDKAGFLSRERYFYEDLVRFLSRSHLAEPENRYASLAFGYAESAKARSFLDLLSDALKNVEEGVDPDLLAQRNQLLTDLSYTRQDLTWLSSQTEQDRDQIAQYRNQLEELESEYSLLQREIRASSPRYSALQYPQPSSLEEIQATALEEDVVLLEYAVGDSSTTLWAVTPESYSLFLLPGRQTLEEELDLLRISLTDPNRGSPELFAQSAHRLYRMLLEPAEGLIADGKKLVIIPDDVLYYLPFEALLVVEADENDGFGQFPYLIRQNAVSYAQSASVLKQLRTGRGQSEAAPGKRLLAFGDPVYAIEDESDTVEYVDGGAMRAGLERLPFSGEEVLNIARFFSPDEADVFVRGEATEEWIKASSSLDSYRYIHFATHGLINERRPDFSSIVLAHTPDRTEDGFLLATEIFNLKLNADLVVLSACETGLGKMVRGEGMVGLTRAFMYAGAQSLVVSLWSVADQSTSILMERFYEKLIVDQLDKTEALRLAKIALIEEGEFTHPFHWAPFVLMGNWE